LEEMNFRVLQEGAAHNALAMATETESTEWPNYDWSTLMLRKLLENQNICDQKFQGIHWISGR
jgi:hypothetical protein